MKGRPHLQGVSRSTERALGSGLPCGPGKGFLVTRELSEDPENWVVKGRGSESQALGQSGSSWERVDRSRVCLRGNRETCMTHEESGKGESKAGKPRAGNATH